jgi:hypothetical protein|tara:strand:- start:638 stop:1168 length:531 start_codon:yes stop_codon:yes gene_type:complete
MAEDKSLYDIKSEMIEEEAQLDNLEYADGKERDNLDLIEEKEKIFGIDRVSPYGTANAQIFEKKLENMTRDQMRALTEKVAARSYSDPNDQKEELMRAFRGWASTNAGPDVSITKKERSNGLLDTFKDTESLDSLKAELKGKTLSELQETAARLGFNPSFDRDRLISVITNEYLKR